MGMVVDMVAVVVHCQLGQHNMYCIVCVTVGVWECGSVDIDYHTSHVSVILVLWGVNIRDDCIVVSQIYKIYEIYEIYMMMTIIWSIITHPDPVCAYPSWTPWLRMGGRETRERRGREEEERERDGYHYSTTC